ncbi:GCD14-domain-containing protein [Rickenella mellea]|uniref:tRNA (adenine(58)-N(1))-methyltransferase catalytic subunit TRM61 n=1 Tax=Rickenella mellea TaxID=50990 RepID=A0A4Y7Q5R5_9AGAM|nr:GCD14-domain-containing protein [Rickenella mellea]
MWSTAREVAAGDTVIVWLTREVIQPLVISPGKELHGRFGVYRHSDLVGVPYGSKVSSRNGKGFIYILRPTPELWTQALPHRTQILYLADISFVILSLGLVPGCRVIEAGTGSGSFSHSVVRTIGPSGRLYSYEFHEARANKAREEFARHGMSDVVSLTHTNVCKDGFNVVNEVDAVFLDLPAPWDAVSHAKLALRRDKTTRICCYSPCMEQVLRTVSALNEAGFTEITMYETLLRPHEVHQIPKLQAVGEISDKLKRAEIQREEKRLKQIASAKKRSEALGKGKRKRDGLEDETPTKGDPTMDDAEASKRLRVESDGVDEPMIISEDVCDDLTMPEPATTNISSHTTEPAIVLTEAKLREQSEPLHGANSARVTMSKVMYEVRGHTSYLTFALLLPSTFPGSEPPSDCVPTPVLIDSAQGHVDITSRPTNFTDSKV